MLAEDPTRLLGRKIVSGYGHSLGFFSLWLSVLSHLRDFSLAPVRTVFLRQLYFTGLQALGWVAVIGLLLGMAIITQIANLSGSNATLIAKILIWTVVRELGPLFAAIMVMSRSCPAMAAELASMKVAGEVEHLREMGISPVGYLVVPRLLGTGLSLLLLTFYFLVVTIAGGLGLSSLLLDIPFANHLAVIFSTLSLLEVGAALLKGLIFGLLISSIACHYGLSARGSITEIPQVTGTAVMQSLFAVLVVNVLITLLVFVW